MDREFALHFRDEKIRKGVMAEVIAPFVKAAASIQGIPGSSPKTFGGECDLLSLDAKGRLLAVEVKPRGTGTLVWAGAQATVYARLIERWLKTPPSGTDKPVTILRGMLDQRSRLGLAPAERVGVAESPVVVPVVAVQRGASQVYLDRLAQVQQELISRRCGDPLLEVYEVNMAGRMDRLQLS